MGGWKGGKRHGKGRVRHANGDVYVGEYVADEKCGHGVLETARGVRYEGGFYAGLYHGQGTFTQKGKATLVGEWKHGVYVGPTIKG